MEQVRMETCSRCKERWFSMDLKERVCHACFLRGKANKTPFLMSAENGMDPGEPPAHLPALTQIEEMIIARSRVQMMIYRYRGHQYHYSGHCVSFMQNTMKTVDVLPNLPAELDVVMRITRITGISPFPGPDRRPTDRWRHILIVSRSDRRCGCGGTPGARTTGSRRAAPAEFSIDGPQFNVAATEADLIVREIASRNSPPPSIPAPSIRQTPIDEASGQDRIFTMAFPTGQADFNTPRMRKVDLNDYARHLMCFHDGGFGRHPCWLFFVFNLLMCRKANSSARFYVSKASGLKDLSREELTEALRTNEGPGHSDQHRLHMVHGLDPMGDIVRHRTW
ncbi:uncharacterized protein Z518_01879 [Rhinocladiella mackenziei CBS 650.93]|uniref:Rhinocladiella mackenziei CBS 650.93 unplaced genomic scaffold supercont1.2, whole genome shotgun sequence n=1 Tax=Rhinocladiella mackenziei CBS 650.93 TaxID=1442369 RepID=A0A0D2IVJ4_9EURO|nr:uncharacterized protein Z518_01879 [Rhinocladiella mackenziei CBS 650.93]KIX07226.1 hypothetical protein Z518_01879 [Rhinocladiella mackenziei CBS 650.93]